MLIAVVAGCCPCKSSWKYGAGPGLGTASGHGLHGCGGCSIASSLLQTQSKGREGATHSCTWPRLWRR